MKRVEWYGHPAHFCGGNECRFVMHTLVDGAWVVSTVGDYYPQGEEGGRQGVGYNRLFETFVFKAAEGKFHDCGCPVIADLSEVETAPANDPATARENHLGMVRRYLSKGNDEKGLDVFDVEGL